MFVSGKPMRDHAQLPVTANKGIKLFRGNAVSAFLLVYSKNRPFDEAAVL